MTGKRLLAKALVAGILLLLPAAGVCGATVTLQQGADGYAGCRSQTVWPGSGKVVRHDVKGAFPLRGSQHHFFLRFDVPRPARGQVLARARLMVFLPEARKPNSFIEIFCHEVISGGRDKTIDETTDYGNGRRVGAVDSVELFSHVDGKNWRAQRYLPTVPAGGTWIEFNVTPLAAKWLSGDLNYGLMLMPAGRCDHDPPSTWEIDVAAHDHPDAKLRPKLVLEYVPSAEQQRQRDCLVGMTDSLRRVCDRSSRYGYRGGYQTEYTLAMAANEFEGFQVVVYPMLADVEDARFTWSDLTGPNGAKIPAADVECFLQDVYTLRRNWMTAPVFYGGKLYEVPDPLIPLGRRPAPCPRHVHTPFLFRVRTRSDTPAGTYTGTITLTEKLPPAAGPGAARRGGIKPVQLKLTVKVWPFRIPEKWNFHTMGSYGWGACARFHGKAWDAKLQRRYYDFLMDHRFSPTEQYGRNLSPRQDLAHCLDRGMNTVYLSGNYTGGKGEMAALKRDYEKVKQLGALDYTLMYIGDETSNWGEMHRRAALIHANLPGVLAMIGGSVPRKELLGHVDVYDPIIGPNRVYGLAQDATNLIRESQQRGEEFYWYVAAGPSWPYPNVQVEYPLVASRVLFWMTWKYGVTGFEYYCYNIWGQRNWPRGGKAYPDLPWRAAGWEKGWCSNGDGMLFYPGPVTSLRFEAIRDGIEDWEALLVLRDHVEALKRRGDAAKHAGLIARAEKLLKVDDAVVKDYTTFTTDPARLLAERRAAAGLIAECVDAGVSAEDYRKAAGGRIADQTTRRRNMLRQRHLEACKRLKAEPLSQEAWDALWPIKVKLLSIEAWDPLWPK